ncbi:MAG: hypothetical protein R3277_04100 [Brumimicrobium sp.]|nr:hypothetical protein [Brumimicrobium sp.]
MNFWLYLTFALFSTWKFLFTPMAGPAAGLSFTETLISCLIGGYISAGIFYFGSSYFMKRSLQNRVKKEEILKKEGKPLKLKKRFTSTNRWIIRIKNSLGKYGVTYLFPLFLSIPIGTVITAKFYKHQKDTFFWIVLFLTLNGLLITGGTYLLTFVV